MALDVGDARIGVAMSDGLGMLAHPAAIIERRAGDPVGKISRMVADNAVIEVVVGLPRNMDGSEGSQARKARALAERIRAAVPGLAILFRDERLTTVEARALRAESGASRSRRQKPVDDLSAALILQGHLEALRLKESR